jgi:hypothetical protein
MKELFLKNILITACCIFGFIPPLPASDGLPSDFTDFTDEEGNTALHRAAFDGDLDMISHLLGEYQGIINLLNDNGDTALHVAAREGDIRVIDVLLDAQADATISNVHGHTVVQLVALYRGDSLTLLRHLQERGVNMFAPGSHGFTLLQIATHWRLVDVVQWLRALKPVISHDSEQKCQCPVTKRGNKD